jgi:RHH-type transcriptional regulator, proline utilization regulon repressor / proline dehydrogenase / delta 1-pyrroline-5-carboxylate dehydrogenase
MSWFGGHKSKPETVGPNGSSGASVEARTRAVGTHLLAAMGHTKGSFGGSGFTANLVNSVMEDPAFKVEMFRFVDVLPVLHNADAVARHIQEYFSREGGPAMPGWMRAGTKLAASGFAKGLIARQIEKNVVAMARNFIVGETGEDALKNLATLRASGLCTTIDLLGEKTLGADEADVYQARYIEVLESLAGGSGGADCAETATWGEVPRVNVSIKLSALDPHFDPADRAGLWATAQQRVLPIMRRAKALGAFVNVDMEDDANREATLWLFEQLASHPDLTDYPHLGIVVQAYLVDSHADLERMAACAKRRGTPITIRLVKGAYWDFEQVHAAQNGWPVPVYLSKADTDANYEALTRALLDRADVLRPAIASHNARSIAVAIAEAEARGMAPEDLEFQMLYGMGEGLRDAVRSMGYRLRIYTPVGEMLPGMAYLVRRLLENTSNESWLVGASADTNPESLLSDPTEQGGDCKRAARQTFTSRSVDPAALPAFANEPLVNFSRYRSTETCLDAHRTLAGQLPTAVRPHIDGEWQSGAGDSWTHTNPSDSDQAVAEVAGASTEQAESAVAAAQRAAAAWSDLPVERRAARLLQLADVLRQRRTALTVLITTEVGKPFAEADGDVAEAIDFCEYYARRALELQTDHPLQSGLPGESNSLNYHPRGVAAVIAPWNFPLAILTGMTAAAAVVGNTVIMKPAEQSSAVAQALMDAVLAAGFPAGVIQFLPGTGETVGAHLVDHPNVSTIAFTGSMGVGLDIVRRAAVTGEHQAQVRRVVCEMGGKNAVVVDDDADLDEAVSEVLKSTFGFAGQKCSACSRAIVLAPIYDAFCARLKDGIEALHVGPAERPGMHYGPVVDAAAKAKCERYIALGHDEGRLLTEVAVPRGGHFVAPSVFVDVAGDARLAQEEVFGPVLAVIRADDLDHAMRLANSTRFALTGAFFSRSPLRIEAVRRRFEVGNLYLNRGCTGALVERHPFGGFKMSGIGGKAGGPDYLLQFVDARAVCENTMRRGFAPELL